MLALFAASRALRLATPPRLVVSMSGGMSRDHEKRLLRCVMAEALDAQQRKRTALEEQLGQDAAPLLNSDDEKAAKAREKALRRALQVPVRLAEVDAAETKLHELQAQLSSGADVMQVRFQLEHELGLAERLSTFDVDSVVHQQWGSALALALALALPHHTGGPRRPRLSCCLHCACTSGPEGFEGLVIQSPRGIPILVAQQSFSDSLLRRIGQGTDLWFQASHGHMHMHSISIYTAYTAYTAYTQHTQHTHSIRTAYTAYTQPAVIRRQVSEGRGSRVLLRTSLVRSVARAPRECMETASDLAAYFSNARHTDEAQVMFTDSRHVAKRGGRVGQLKEAKKLGVIQAKPARVAEVARSAQEEQGRL